MAKDEKQTKKNDEIKPREITKELQESYLDYAMSVIVARALPDIRDGLKPVQRRILWAMWDMSLRSDAKYVKSARVVGDTMGKFHPHGDAAVYDALVRMAQNFSLRYPLVQGQGNFGNIDGDGAAAQRYTEARLSKISEEMLLDIEKETVDWRPNYDNSREEPVCLPARLPNLLLNGVTGIAVGMATSIPPHNLGEIVDAIIFLADNPKAGISDLMEFIPGPDFPTGGIIYGRSSIEEAYSTGRGSVTIRAKTEIDESGQGSTIIIHEIPYQVNKADLITNIASLVQDKKVEGIKDIRDESDRDGMRITISVKKGSSSQKILNKLFKHTRLQKNFYFNMVALIDGIQPQVVSIKDVLVAYLDHRKQVVKRRTEFDLAKAEARAHILEGLVKALKSIDKIISVIKKSKDKAHAHKNLVSRFKMTAVQADAILDMKLQTLASLESQKLKDELKEKQALIKDLKSILANPKKMLGIIKDELKDLKELFADSRKTETIEGQVKEFKQEDFVPKQEAVVFLSDDGYIKRLSPSSFKIQRRGGKGLIGFDLKEEDRVDTILLANTHDNLLFFTDKGKVFRTKVYEVPQASRTARGKLINSFLGLSDNERVAAILSYEPNKKNLEKFVVMATKNGLIKRTRLDDFDNVRKNGIIAIKIKSGDTLGWAGISSGNGTFMVITQKGSSIRFNETDVRPMGRTASGVRAASLKKGDSVTDLVIIEKTTKAQEKAYKLLVVMEKGFGKRTELGKYKTQRRGGGGLKTANVTKKTGLIISAKLVDDDVSEILAFSAKGKVIKTDIKNIRISGRATQGVRIMNVAKDDVLVGVVCM